MRSIIAFVLAVPLWVHIGFDLWIIPVIGLQLLAGLDFRFKK
jgi:hypothetical protein